MAGMNRTERSRKRFCVGAWVLGMALTCGCGSKTGLSTHQDSELGSSTSPRDTSVNITIPPLTMDGAVDAGRDALTFDASLPPCEEQEITTSTIVRPLDLFMLFDASNSMHDPTDGVLTRWEAVRAALERFLEDPNSSGIGTALTFFPRGRDTVPSECSRDSQCGMVGACTFVGVCSNAGTRFCAPCWAHEECSHQSSCEPDDYAGPDIGVERLPSASTGILAAFDIQETRICDGGGTPTLPAMVGTMRGALAWSRAHPSHEVAVVLSTDGYPNTCDWDAVLTPEGGIDNVADEARRGVAEANVRTFVIGVFGRGEEGHARTGLDRIATAGGTAASFLVSTDGTSTTAYLEALEEIRRDRIECDFALAEPMAFAGGSISVRIRHDGRDEWLRRVRGPEACDAGGFYLPGATDVAARVALCPETCALLAPSPRPELTLRRTCPH